MKKLLFSALAALIMVLPAYALAEMPGGHGHPAQNTEVGVGVDNRVLVEGTQFAFDQQFITNGPDGVTRSLIGGLVVPYLNMQQAGGPYPIGQFRPVALPPRHIKELYTLEELEKIISSKEDIFQVPGKLRLVAAPHDRQFVYTLPPSVNPAALGLMPLFKGEIEAPANGNLDEALLRLQSIGFAATNSFIMTVACTEDVLNKYANNGGGLSGSASGFMGNVMTGTGLVAQDSVAVSRAYRVGKCQLTYWSTNVIDFDDYLKLAANTAPPEMLASVYLYKDQAQRQAEFASAMAKLAEDEAYLKRLREAGQVDFVAFYLKEEDKATAEAQLLAFQQEFGSRLQAKGVQTQNWKSQLVATAPNAPAQQRTDIAGGIALYIAR